MIRLISKKCNRGFAVISALRSKKTGAARLAAASEENDSCGRFFTTRVNSGPARVNSCPVTCLRPEWSTPDL